MRQFIDRNDNSGDKRAKKIKIKYSRGKRAGNILQEESTAEEVVSCGHIITGGPREQRVVLSDDERMGKCLGGLKRSGGVRGGSAGVHITAHLAAGSYAPFFGAPFGPEQVHRPMAKMSPFRSHKVRSHGT